MTCHGVRSLAPSKPALLRHCVLTLLGLIPTALLGAPLPFADTFESGLSQWSTNGGWALTTSWFASPNHSATESPGSYYANLTDASLTLATPLSLAGTTRPALRFHYACRLEPGYDFARVEVSTDGGTSWLPTPLATLSGTTEAATPEQLDLSAYATAANFKLRFRVVTDATVVMDGFYVDDIRIDEAPAPVTLNPPTAPSPNQVALSWSASTAPNFAAYRVFRSAAPGIDWHTAPILAEITDPATTALLDITVGPKSTYFYKVLVVDAHGLHTGSNEVQATTPAGMDYPFLDNGEAGTAFWIADAPWALDSEAAVSGSHAWSDSPASNYADGISSQALTLAAPMHLAGHAVAPILSFSHSHDFAAGDSGHVEASANLGADWTSLAVFTGSSAGWRRERLSLASFTNATAVLIRFRLTTDPSANAEGWHLDDLSVAESPTVVPAPILSHVTSHTIDLAWAANTDVLFSHYAIFRSTTADVGLNSTLVGVVPSQSTTSLTDSGLDLDTPYYYRVYAVSPYGTFSPSSPEVNQARTLNHPPPFSDTFEGSLINWNLTGAWNVSTAYAHSGTQSLADSPSAPYPNSSDSYALTAVDLRGLDWPVLRFWDRHALASGDWGRLEVSADGTSWSPLYGVSQSRASWAQQSIDLSPWKGQPNLRLRFHLWSDGAATDDGWFIDDLALAEHSSLSLAYPFTEDFEAGLDRWLHAAWVTDPTDPYAGAASAHDTVPTAIPPDTALWLTLAGPLDLTTATNPQLTFWLRGHLYYRSFFRLQVSTDGGLSWPDLPGYQDHDWNSDWTRRQVSLAAYAGQSIRLRFGVYSIWGTAPDEDIFLDQITVADLPAAVVLNAPVPHLKSVDLNWSTSTLGPNFQRYEVYRATHADVGLGDTRIATFTDPATTSLTDAGLSIGTTYYYRVFTVDARDTYTPSNERAATTVPVTAPLTDALESLDQWVTTGSWAIDSDNPHGGSGSLADSATGDYPNSSDSYALTAVDLRGLDWPVLRFWDRHALASGDWGRLEVSADGTSWSPLYGVSQSRASWAQQSIDLSPWKGQPNLRLRFHLWSDGAATDDGWFIDDLALAEHSPLSLAYPFTEDFEAGLDRWLHAAWVTDPTDPYAGAASAHDTVPTAIPPDTALWLTLAGPLDLTTATNPQLTFWLRGHLYYRSFFRIQVSTDGGLSWPDLPGYQDHDWNSDWTRRQVSLNAYAGQSIRLRFGVYSIWGSAPDEDVFLDQITVADLPESVVLQPLDNITVSSMRLTWTESTLSDFAEYRVYRSEASGTSEGSTLVGVISDRATTTFTDTGLRSRQTYFYRVYTVNSRDTTTGSNQSSATTLGVAHAWADDFSSDQSAWSRTGGWTLQDGAGRDGSPALVDSAADYDNNTSSYAQFAVDLTDADWPVLRFWDRHAVASGDWGRLYISGDAGGSWSSVYGVSGTRTAWAEQAIDLSPWKNRTQVWIRFQLNTDGGTTADGWSIDDVSLAEHAPAPATYPLFETFEASLDRWLAAGWSADTDAPMAGSQAVHDTVNAPIPPDTSLSLVLAETVDLSTAVNPQLTFWIRGHLYYRSFFRVQISTDGGLNWSDLPAGQDHDWNADWARRQVSLSAYVGQTLRLRFVTYSIWGTAPDEDILLDQIGIGEDTPGAPSVHAPAPSSIVEVARPALAVHNAIDYQTDAVVYQFEVYTDAALTQVVAQNPGVASGAGLTTWTVDVNLPSNHQYWWRSRALQGALEGPWMPAATFYVNELNNAPIPVIVATPPQWLLANTNGILTWYPTVDPDAGDSIRAYRLQIDDDAAFGSPLVDRDDLTFTNLATPGDWTLSLPLSRFPETVTLVAGRTYYWRVAAQDSRYKWSDWNATPATFAFGFVPIPTTTLSRVSTPSAGQVQLEWTGATQNVYVEFQPTLGAGSWSELAGPLTGSQWTGTAPASQGFYRLRLH